MNDVVLIITNSSDATADYLCNRINRDSIPYIRFNSDTALTNVFAEYENGIPILTIDEAILCPENIRHIWLRRPEELDCHVNGVDESEQKHIAEEWSAAIDGFFAHIPLAKWINHPSKNAAASHKIEQITRAHAVGLLTPETLMTRKPESLRRFWDFCKGEVIVKPMISGYLERSDPASDTLIYTNRVLAEHIDQVGKTLPHCPTLFQRMIRKQLDIRIASIDKRLYPIGIEANDGHSQRLDIRRNNMEDVYYRSVSIPKDIEDKLLQLLDSYNLRFAAVDMAIGVDGQWVFFEINPNGQWAWTDIAGATDIASGFIDALGKANPHDSH